MSRNDTPDDQEFFTGAEGARLGHVSGKRFREKARTIFADKAPGSGRVWKLTRAEVDEILRHC